MSLESTQISALESVLTGLGPGPILVHSDLMRAGLVSMPGTRERLLQTHVEILLAAADSRDLWMPTFNYGFPRTRWFDVTADLSEVGPLTEYFRTTSAAWRTPVPIFSFAGTGDAPQEDSQPEIDPFGKTSGFADLVRLDGSILFYGTSLHSATFIHYVERNAVGPPYRYDKRFSGRVILASRTIREVVLLYHVRPLDQWLDYDWPRLLEDLSQAGICRIWESGRSRLMASSARQLLAFWQERLTQDSLYFLDRQSRSWVEPLLAQLGRRFIITDFEQLIS